jgi:hypothetical protein
MQRSGVISIAILFLLVATTSPGHAQQEQQRKEEGKPQQGQQHQTGRSTQQQHPQPAQQQHQPQANRPAQRPQAPQPQERPQTTYGAAYHGGVQPTGPTHGGVHHSGVPQQKTQVRSGFGQSRAHAWNEEHRSWTQRGGYNGYRVPEDRVRAYWGRSHSFRIYSLPLLFVGGYPRFRYDGYWVTLVDPWPEPWPANWYETDDVYLDYTDDGYYLYNLSRPGPAIAVTISF